MHQCSLQKHGEDDLKLKLQSLKFSRINRVRMSELREFEACWMYISTQNVQFQTDILNCKILLCVKLKMAGRSTISSLISDLRKGREGNRRQQVAQFQKLLQNALLGGAVVRALDLRLKGRGFKSQPLHCRVRPWTSWSHTLSSASGVTTLWLYINQFKLKT